MIGIGTYALMYGTKKSLSKQINGFLFSYWLTFSNLEVWRDTHRKLTSNDCHLEIDRVSPSGYVYLTNNVCDHQ